MKAYITKYALSKGIQEVDDAVLCDISGRTSEMISVPSLGVFANFHGEGREWHRTAESAINKACKMRESKKASLRKKLAYLEELTFP